MISAELLGDSERQQEVDGRISVEFADAGRTFNSEGENKYVYRICCGKPVKGSHIDNRIDGITHDIMEQIVRTRRGIWIPARVKLCY